MKILVRSDLKKESGRCQIENGMLFLSDRSAQWMLEIGSISCPASR